MSVLAFLGVPDNPFQGPSILYHLLMRPIHFTLTYIHASLVYLRKKPTIPSRNAIRIVCVSDTHTLIPTIPEGDVLIHAGDLTNAGTVAEIQDQLDWLDKLPHQYVVVISGNHDSFFDSRSRRPQDVDKKLDFGRVQYLQHSGTNLEFPAKGDRKLKVYGAPQIPECGGEEHAFQYRRQDDAWTNTLPKNIDVLITHTPPRWHLDLPWGMGCDFLLKELWRIKPDLHVFGHVHAGRGKQLVYWGDAQKAFEKAMSTQRLLDIINPIFWVCCLQVIFFDITGIVWTRIWGSESQSTLMVNSALVDYHGRLRNPAQVVEI